MVEIKHIDLPPDMQRAMARQAEAERLRRAKVISAEGEYQAAARLGEAAAVMEGEPIAMTLRSASPTTSSGRWTCRCSSWCATATTTRWAA